MTDDELIDRVLDREGGFVNHPADPGRATKWGITQATLSQWRGQDATVADIRALSRDEAREIYRLRYLAPFTDAPIALKEHLFDIAVHSGLQTAKTLRRRADDDPARLFAERLKYLSRLVQSKPTLSVFLPGWINRVLEFAPWERPQS